LPEHLEQDDGDHGVDVDAVNIPADAGGKQCLHQFVVEIEKYVIASPVTEQFAYEDLAWVEVNILTFEHRVVDAGDLGVGTVAFGLGLFLVRHVILGVDGCYFTQVQAVFPIPRIDQPRVTESLQQEGDGLEPVTAMGISGMG